MGLRVLQLFQRHFHFFGQFFWGGGTLVLHFQITQKSAGIWNNTLPTCVSKFTQLQKATAVSDAVLQAKLGAEFADLEQIDGLSADEAKALSLINAPKAG